MNIKKGISYKEFLKRATIEQLEMIKEQEKLALISGEGIKEAKSLTNEVNIDIYTETRCKDAATAIPILIEMSEINSNIKLNFHSLEENKEVVENLVGEARIPTIIRVDDSGELIKKYIEFPARVNAKITEENKKEIVEEFRTGIYSKIIEDEFIDIIK